MIWTNDETQMEGQLSIFDCFDNVIDEPVYTTKNLELMTEEEMVKTVGEKLGVEFKFRDEFYGYEYKPRKYISCHVSFGRFSCGGVGYNEGQRFISCSINLTKGSMMGTSGPYLSIGSAVQFFEQMIPRYIQEGER